MREHTNNHTSHPTSTSTPSGRQHPPGPEVLTEGLLQQGDSPPVGPTLAPDDSRNCPLMDAALNSNLTGTASTHGLDQSPDELLDHLSGPVPVEGGVGPVASDDVSDGSKPGGTRHDSTVEDEVEVASDSIRVSNAILTDSFHWDEEEVERRIKQVWDNAADQLRRFKPTKPRNVRMLRKHYEVIEILVCDMTVIHEYPLPRTLSYLLAYIGWLDENGYPVTEEMVLNRTNIESAISDFAPRYQVSSLRTMRSCLIDFIWALGGDMKPRGGTWPIGRNDLTTPYCNTDVAWLAMWAEQHSARAGFTTARMSLVLGLGAGGDPGESMQIQADDIVATPNGVVVTFPDGRKVTVRREFEGLATETLPLLEPGWVLMPRSKARAAHILYAFMNWNSDRRNGFLITMRRMRITWMMRHLVEGLPLDVLLASAQMETTAGLSRYLVHFPSRNPAEVAQLLRGEGWS